MREFRSSKLVGAELALAALSHWLEHKVPKSLLVLVVFILGYFGSRSVVLLSELHDYFVPSIKAVIAQPTLWPLFVVLWAYVVLFVCACAIIKQVAFKAAVQLHRRFGVTHAP